MDPISARYEAPAVGPLGAVVTIEWDDGAKAHWVMSQQVADEVAKWMVGNVGGAAGISG